MVTTDPGIFAQRVDWNGRWLWLRHLRSDDAKRYADFHASLDLHRVNGGFFALLPLPADVAAGPSYRDGRNITLIAVLDDAPGTMLGIARAKRCPNEKIANVAIALRSDVEGQGLGRLLMGRLVTDCRASDLLELAGDTRVDNRRMIDLARAFRFVITPATAPGVVLLRLELRQPLRD